MTASLTQSCLKSMQNYFHYRKHCAVIQSMITFQCSQIFIKETEDSLLDTFDNIEEEEFFEVEKMITSSQKSTKSGTNQVWDNTELIPHQQEDNGYLKYFSFFSIHIFHHLLGISHKTHHVPMRLCCKFNL